MGDQFRTANHKGGPLRCIFCSRAVWWHLLEYRWYERGGEEAHADNCPAGTHWKRIERENAKILGA